MAGTKRTGVSAGIEEEVKEEKQVEKSAAVVEFKKPFEVWEVGGEEYRLKLNASNVVKIESKYSCSILSLMMEDDGVPELGIMLTILQAAMLPYQHGIDINDVYRIFDTYVDEGGDQMSLFTGVVLPTLATSGFFPKNLARSLQKSLQDL